MTHSPSDVVRKLLIEAGIGTLPTANGDWPIACGAEQDTPDNTITVYDTQGSDDGRVMVGGELQGLNGVQVQVRARTHKIGWAKADAIQSFMAETCYEDTVTIEGVSYLIRNFSGIGDVLPLGPETPASNRKLFTINALVNVDQLD